MSDRPATERELLRWAEALSSTAMTGLGFTDNLYERERFEEVLEIAADIRSHVVGGSTRSARCRSGSTASVWASPGMSRPRSRSARSWATTTASC